MNVFLIGDSTMQYNSILTYPQTGWGQVLHMFFNGNVNITNLAKNGRSTRTFIEERRFDEVIDNIKKGDYVICQFGHNDQSELKEDRYTTPKQYVANLDYFVGKVKELGANIIMATSIARLLFENDVCINSHGIYPKLMLDYSKEKNIECIDLNDITINHFNTLGYGVSKRYFMIFDKGVHQNYKDGLNDHTHLVYEGAILIAKLFVMELKKLDNKLSKGLL